jgi:glucan phosphoethanolaminetransferase (alkaline phosphatase superfamily)
MQVTASNLLEPILGVSSLGWGLAFGVSAIANIFLYAFMLEIFSKGMSAGGAWFKLYVIVEAVVAVLLPVFGPLSLMISVFKPLLLLVLVTHLVCAYALYIKLAMETTASMRKTTDTTARRGFSLIRLGAVFLMIAYLFFVLDRVWEYTLEPEGYTIWVILGWITSGIVGILLYSGFVLPTRMRGMKQS